MNHLNQAASAAEDYVTLAWQAGSVAGAGGSGPEGDLVPSMRELAVRRKEREHLVEREAVAVTVPVHRVGTERAGRGAPESFDARFSLPSAGEGKAGRGREWASVARREHPCRKASMQSCAFRLIQMRGGSRTTSPRSSLAFACPHSGSVPCVSNRRKATYENTRPRFLFVTSRIIPSFSSLPMDFVTVGTDSRVAAQRRPMVLRGLFCNSWCTRSAEPALRPTACILPLSFSKRLAKARAVSTAPSEVFVTPSAKKSSHASQSPSIRTACRSS